MSTPTMFACLACGHPAFLIRGLCDICAPDLHQDYRDGMEWFQAADELFYAETGHHALEDWYGFEAFVARRADADEGPGGDAP